jgi:GT2 family glycosyltransferase
MLEAIGVSIIIPHFPNTRKKELGRLLGALRKQTIDNYELLVIEERKSAFENNNKGWKKAAGDIVWFLADDVIPEPHALERALQIFENETVDGVEGHIYGKLNRIFELGFMSGHIFYTREILEKVGGFDERFAAWRGDTDLAWTIIECGGTIKYCPESRVKHPGKASTVPDMRAEMLLREKHPEMYRMAKDSGRLHCLL